MRPKNHDVIGIFVSIYFMLKPLWLCYNDYLVCIPSSPKTVEWLCLFPYLRFLWHWYKTSLFPCQIFQSIIFIEVSFIDNINHQDRWPKEINFIHKTFQNSYGDVHDFKSATSVIVLIPVRDSRVGSS